MVVVDGAMSTQAPLKNSVYQSTLLGPPRWNGYYEDRWCRKLRVGQDL